MSLTFDIDMTQFHQRVRSSRSAIERDIQDSVTRAAKHGAEVAKGGGWRDRTGKLRATIIHKGIGWSGQTYWGAFQTQVGYAVYVEYDTKPHEIRGNPMLAFYWESRGVNFVGPKVNHPGTTGFGYMRVGGNQAREALINDLHSLEHLRAIWS
jgi:hypothetical protein